MKNLRKALALLIAVSMMLSTSVFGASFTDVADDAAFAEAIGVGTALNLFNGYEDGTFKADGDITRAEFAAIVTRMMGGESASAKQPTAFSDVPADHWASGYIRYCSEGDPKIINGMGDGTFAPDETVTYEQAIKMIVVALGYEPKVSGGYPTGYLTVASELELPTKVGGVVGQKATRGQVAQIIFNALDVPMMAKTNFGVYEDWKVQDGYDNTTRKTILSEKLGVVKIKGFVSDTNEFTSTKDLTVTMNITNNYNTKYKDDFKVDTKQSFLVGSSNAKDYLGYMSIFFVSYDQNSSDDSTVLFAKKDLKTSDELDVKIDDLELEVSLVDKAGMWQMAYWPSEGANKTEKFTIDKKSNVYINGEKKTIDLNTLFAGDGEGNPNNTDYLNSGSVSFVKVDSDNKVTADYNNIFVTNYQSFVVESVSETAKKVYSKAGNISTISFDPKDTTTRASLKDSDGKAIEWTSLKENDVLSIKANDKSSTLLVLDCIKAGDTVEGKITEVDDDKYKIGDKFYKTDSTTFTQTIKLDDEGLFLLDVNGKIVYFTKTAGKAGKYAYVMNAGALSSGLDTDKVELKLFNFEGQIMNTRTASKIKLNNESGLKANENGEYTLTKAAVKTVGPDQLIGSFITYKTNQAGEITEITQPRISSSLQVHKDEFAMYATSVADNVYADGDLVFANSDDTTFNKKAKSVSVNGKTVYVDDTTVVMVAPGDLSVGTTYTEDDFQLLLAANIDDDQFLGDVTVYDVNENTKVAGAVLINSDPVLTSATNGMAMVVSKSMTTDAEGDNVYKITVIQDGEKKSFTTREDNDLDLEKGTSFIPSYDSLNRLKSASIFAYTSKNAPIDTTVLKALETDKVKYYAGEVVNRSSNRVTFADGTDVVIGGAKVAVYDETMGTSFQVAAGDISDIDVRTRVISGHDTVEYKDGVSKVYMVAREYEGKITDVVVYLFK